MKLRQFLFFGKLLLLFNVFFDIKFRVAIFGIRRKITVVIPEKLSIGVIKFFSDFEDLLVGKFLGLVKKASCILDVGLGLDDPFDRVYQLLFHADRYLEFEVGVQVLSPDGFFQDLFIFGIIQPFELRINLGANLINLLG